MKIYVTSIVAGLIVGLVFSASALAADLTARVIILEYTYYKTTWAHMQLITTDQGIFIRKHKNQWIKGPAEITYEVREDGRRYVTSLTKIHR